MCKCRPFEVLPGIPALMLPSFYSCFQCIKILVCDPLAAACVPLSLNQYSSLEQEQIQRIPPVLEPQSGLLSEKFLSTGV